MSIKDPCIHMIVYIYQGTVLAFKLLLLLPPIKLTFCGSKLLGYCHFKMCACLEYQAGYNRKYIYRKQTRQLWGAVNAEFLLSSACFLSPHVGNTFLLKVKEDLEDRRYPVTE